MTNPKSLDKLAPPFDPSCEVLSDAENLLAHTRFLTLIEDIFLDHMVDVKSVNEYGTGFWIDITEKSSRGSYVSHLEVSVIEDATPGRCSRKIQIVEMDTHGVHRIVAYVAQEDSQTVLREDSYVRLGDTSIPGDIERILSIGKSEDYLNETENQKLAAEMGIDGQPVGSAEIMTLGQLFGISLA